VGNVATCHSHLSLLARFAWQLRRHDALESATGGFGVDDAWQYGPGTESGRAAPTQERIMTASTSQAVVTGPVTGGVHGWPFGVPLFDLADHGYVAEEFFLAGDASTYRQVPGTSWDRDGHWQVERDGSLPYTTRILIYRPVDPAKFNGTVVVGWNNVTAGYELFSGESPEFFEGYVFVGATVQHVGVHGFPTNSQGLAA
jgi:hypothetical protein